MTIPDENSSDRTSQTGYCLKVFLKTLFGCLLVDLKALIFKNVYNVHIFQYCCIAAPSMLGAWLRVLTDTCDITTIQNAWWLV